jgi:hypothetical protein
MRPPWHLMVILLLVLAACGNGQESELPTLVPVEEPTQPEPVEAQPEPQAEPTQDPVIEVDPDFVMPTSPPISAEDEGIDFTPQDLPPEAEGPVFDDLVAEALGTEVSEAPPTRQPPSGDGALAVAPPGTLVASETEEPEPGGMFEFIYFEQTGGPGNEEIIFQIFPDGRVVSEDRTVTVGQNVIEGLNHQITELNFFGMQGNLMGPPGRADEYRYRIAVGRNGMERAISAQDRYMPPEFISFLSMIRNAGDTLFAGS